METLVEAQRLGYRSGAFNNGMAYLRASYKSFATGDRIKALSVLYEAREELNYQQELDEFNENELSFFDRLQLTALKQQLHVSHFAGFIFKGIQRDVYGGIYWNNARVNIYQDKTSATLLAYTVLKNENTDSAILSGIIQHFFNEAAFSEGNYRNTLHSAQVLQAMATDIARYESNVLKASFKIDGEPVSELLPLKKTLRAGQPYTVTKTGAKARMFVYKTVFTRDPVADSTHFVIISSFSQEGKTADTLKLNIPVTMQVQINVRKNAEYILVEIPVPAGCTYADKVTGFGEVYSEFHKDRVQLFFRRINKGTYTFTIHLEPRFEGKFTLLPTVVSNMYDIEITGNNKAKKVYIAP